jgi:hypothetical protein
MTDTGANIPPGYRLATYQDGYEAGYADARATDRAELEALLDAVRPIMPYLIEFGHPDEPEYPDSAIVIRGAGTEWITAGNVRHLRAALAAQDRTVSDGE